MRLLLIEDDTALADGLLHVFSRGGYTVTCARSGGYAESILLAQEFDLVILDLGLPDKDGFEVLQTLRARKNATPVLILTARDAWHEKVDGFNAGADDYVAKPFHVEELVARLGALIRRAHAQSAGVVCAEGLTLDETRQVALCGDREIVLSGIEFRLLRYFMLHAGQVLSKSHLAEHLYASDADPESNVIEVHVNRLRGKLGADYITTRRGQGYVFGTPV